LAVSTCPVSIISPGGFVPGDTVVTIYDGNVGTPGPMLCCSDSSVCGPFEAEVCCSVVAGSLYYVQISNQPPGGPLTGVVSVNHGVGICGCPPPPNDECVGGAIPVFDGCNGPFTNVCATTSAPATGCGLMGADVWFAFTPTHGCTALISTFGSNFDTVLRVFDACPSSGVELDCNDDSPKMTWPSDYSADVFSSYVEIPITIGATYYVAVGGFAGATGVFNLHIRTDFTIDIRDDGSSNLVGHFHNGCPNGVVWTIFHLEPLTPTYPISGFCPHFGAGWLFGVQATNPDLTLSFGMYTAFVAPWYMALDGCGEAATIPYAWAYLFLLDAVAIAFKSDGTLCAISPPIRFLE
jgi:hypothetical protein